MGTLTGETPSLAEHCRHKLPTSCRLTATPICCACQDKRPHTAWYSVYVDGVGFVARGTRWQKYCWFCKTFWDNRLADTYPPLDANETRIPEYPEQDGFLDQWFELHRTYQHESADSMALHRGLSELRQVEVWRDVAPGQLPGSYGTSAQPWNRPRAQPAPSSQQRDTEPASIEATLEAMMDEALSEEIDASAEQNFSIIPVDTEALATRIGQLRPANMALLRYMHLSADRVRQLQLRLDSINSLDAQRTLNSNSNNLTADQENQPPGSTREWLEYNLYEANEDLRRIEARVDQAHDRQNPSITQNSSISNNRLRQAHARCVSAQAQRDAAVAALARAEANLASCRSHERQLRAEVRESERLTRVFGTREEMERLGADYTSPISGMFTRAYERFAVAEEVRREERVVNQNQAYRRLVENFNSGQSTRSHIPVATINATGEEFEEENATRTPRLTLEDNEARPEPLTDEEMTVKLICKICLTQRANIACFPCGHMVMCEYCADLQMPTSAIDHTRPQHKHTPCPMCRKRVKLRMKVYAGC